MSQKDSSRALASRIRWTVSATMPLAERRFTATPPMDRIQRPTMAGLNRLSLAQNFNWKPRLHFVSTPIGKSQFDVCG